MSRLRIFLAGAAGIILLAVGLAAVIVTRLDPNRFAPAIIAAVQARTGRNFAFQGPITWHLSLQPSIEVTNVTLGNPPGFADANLLTIGRIEARISLLPLLSHKVDVQNLLLVNPSLTLEKTSGGAADWSFTPPAAPAGDAPDSPVSEKSYKLALEAVAIQNGVVTVKSARGKIQAVLALTSLSGTATDAAAPLHLSAAANYNNLPFTLDGVVGPVERFSGVGTGPWPVDLTLNAAGATATIKGSVAAPLTGHGYDVTVNASIPALEVFAPNLPPIHGLTGTARIVDQGSAIPAIDNLSVKIGASDLGVLRPGLSVTMADFEMPSLDQAMTIAATGAMSGMNLSAAGKIGPVQAFLNPALLPATMPPGQGANLALQLQAGNAQATVAGGIATPGTLAGVALAINATVPDLGALSPLTGWALPKLSHLAIQTNLIDPDGLGLYKAAGLDSLAVSMDNAAFGGDASLYFGARPKLQVALAGQSINLDPLLAAIPKPAPPLQAPAPAADGTPAPSMLIPATPFPLALLQAADADIQLSADRLVWNGATYTGLQGHAVLANGVLKISPLQGELPGGSVAATASLDATKNPAAAKLTINAPALALAPFLKAVGLPDTAEGTIQATVNLTGAGDSLHDLAAGMNGQMGLAAVNGTIDGQVLGDLFGAVLRAVHLPADLIGAQGPVAVRCFGLAVDATDGIGTVKALTLDSSRLLLQGGGTVNFGPETLAVVLRPELQLGGGNPVSVPVQLGGTFLQPTTSVAPAGALAAAASAAVGLTTSLAGDLGTPASLLGSIQKAAGIGAPPDVCPAALALGRLGQPGPAAPPPAAPASAGAAPAPSGPKNLLNILLGK